MSEMGKRHSSRTGETSPPHPMPLSWHPGLVTGVGSRQWHNDDAQSVWAGFD